MKTTTDESPVPALRSRHPASTTLRMGASLLYGLGARIHRAHASFVRGSRGQPSCAVLSVGGLTIGGAGKTPVAAALALGLRRRGRRVVLASGGYRGRSRDRVTVVSDGRRVYSDVAVSGDESLVLAGHAPGVPVLVGRDRRVVAHHAVAIFDAELLVLDDGFQHHRLARDLDLVCIDAVAGLGNRRLLPLGPLREPISVLKNADWLCIVDGKGKEKGKGGDCGTDELESALIVEFASEGVSILRAHRRPTRLRRLDGSERRSMSFLEGRRVGLIAGLARPGSVRRTLEALGAEVVAERFFRDHHAYRAKDFVNLDSSVSDWITTEKDALKILPEWLTRTSAWVLEIEVEFDDAESAIAQIESEIFPGTDTHSD